MSWYFDPNRVTQAAAFLVKCSGSNRMPYLKLLKLLYFADRESLLEKGYPITGDDAFAMDYGPVLTRVYDYIKCQIRAGADVWSKYFCTSGYDIELVGDPGTGELSRYDRRILEAVHDRYKDRDGFDVSHLSHDFPEWKEVYKEGTSTPIPIETILKALDIKIENLQAQIEEDRCYFQHFGEIVRELDRKGGGVLST